MDPIEVTDSFMMDDQNNQFIFIVHQAEDTAGNYLPLPKEVNLAQLLIKMPDTTSTMFASRRYVELSLAEIIAI